MTLKQKEYIKNTPVLETKRLILRPITPDDADSAFVWLGDEKSSVQTAGIEILLYKKHEASNT